MKRDGFSLLETAVGAAAGGIIMLGMLLALNRLLVAEQRLVSYTELQYETDFVMNMIANDVRVADRIYWASPYLSVHVPNVVGSKTVVYSLKDGAQKKLMKDDQPLTGDTELTRLTITRFAVKRLRNDLTQVNIAAQSLSSKQSYELETVIKSQNMAW